MKKRTIMCKPGDLQQVSYYPQHYITSNLQIRFDQNWDMWELDFECSDSTMLEIVRDLRFILLRGGVFLENIF